MSMLTEKWQEVLEHKDAAPIADRWRAHATAQLLENTQESIAKGETASMSSLVEAAPTTNTGNVQNYDPVLISMIRRTTPNLMAFDVAGVQALKGPTGLIFATRSRYVNGTNAAAWPEALFNEANTAFSGKGTMTGTTGVLDPSNTSLFSTGIGRTTAEAEALGGGAPAPEWPEMTFEIEKVSAVANSRNLKAEYSTEVAQDLKAIHGMDAETILSDMLTTELLSEINREVIRTIYGTAVPGAQQSGIAVPGTFNLDVDSNGRWLVEKFKGLMFQIDREANAIAKATRRGKGNIVICSSDVASALQMAGILDHTPALNSNRLNVDDTGNTFVGVLNGQYKVYIDPFAGANFVVVGYKGANPFDAGLFYCPYIPIQMARAIGENNFQYKIGFKTRYALVANPFAEGTNKGLGRIAANTNQYYRRMQIANLV